MNNVKSERTENFNQEGKNKLHVQKPRVNTKWSTKND
jgi:hypothetical protein